MTKQRSDWMQNVSGESTTEPVSYVQGAGLLTSINMEVASTSLAAGDIITLCRLPSSASVDSIVLFNDKLDSHGTETLTFDLGLYLTSAKATADINIISTTAAAVDTETVTLINTAGLSKTYKFMNGGGKSTGDLDGGSCVVQVSGESTAAGLADELKTAINHTGGNGHSATIAITRLLGKLSLQQATLGTDGNRAIAKSAGDAKITKTDFTGGGNNNSKPNTGTVKDVDLFAAGSAVLQGAVTAGTELRYAARNVDTCAKPLFTLVGDTISTSPGYDLCMTIKVKAATAAAGTIGCVVRYTILTNNLPGPK